MAAGRHRLIIFTAEHGRQPKRMVTRGKLGRHASAAIPTCQGLPTHDGCHPVPPRGRRLAQETGTRRLPERLVVPWPLNLLYRLTWPNTGLTHGVARPRLPLSFITAGASLQPRISIPSMSGATSRPRTPAAHGPAILRAHLARHQATALHRHRHHRVNRGAAGELGSKALGTSGDL